MILHAFLWSSTINTSTFQIKFTAATAPDTEEAPDKYMPMVWRGIRLWRRIIMRPELNMNPNREKIENPYRVDGHHRIQQSVPMPLFYLKLPRTYCNTNAPFPWRGDGKGMPAKTQRRTEQIPHSIGFSLCYNFTRKSPVFRLEMRHLERFKLTPQVYKNKLRSWEVLTSAVSRS